MVGHCRDTLQLGTAGILCSWALQENFALGHCEDTLQLGTAGILCGWSLQGYFAVGHCRDTLRMGTEGYLGWALQGYSAVGHCKDSFWLGPTGIFGGWSLKSASSRARTTFTLKSDNPTARVGKNQQFLGGGSILCRFVLHLMRLVMHVYPWLLSRTSSLTCNVHTI